MPDPTPAATNGPRPGRLRVFRHNLLTGYRRPDGSYFFARTLCGSLYGPAFPDFGTMFRWLKAEPTFRFEVVR